MSPLCRVVRLVLLAILYFSYSLPALADTKAAAVSPAETTSRAVQIFDEQVKLQRYQQRIIRLQGTLRDLYSQQKALHWQREALAVASERMGTKYRQARHRFGVVKSELLSALSPDSRARLQQAEFELFLVERKYNQQLAEQAEMEQAIKAKGLRIKEMTTLLLENQRGVQWQREALAKLGAPESRIATAR